jgi:hypothetical protein
VIDRLLAIISLMGLVAFTLVLVVYVKRWDLGIVITICLLMAAYDLLSFGFRSKNGPTESAPPREQAGADGR